MKNFKCEFVLRRLEEIVQQVLTDIVCIPQGEAFDAEVDRKAKESAEGQCQFYHNWLGFDDFYRQAYGNLYQHLQQEYDIELAEGNDDLICLWPDRAKVPDLRMFDKDADGWPRPSLATWRRFIAGPGRRRFNRLRRRMLRVARQNNFVRLNSGLRMGRDENGEIFWANV